MPSAASLIDKASKRKDKTKSKARNSTEATMIVPRNEGTDTNWAFKPPTGMVSLDTSEVDEEFDWDALEKDDEKELWLVRIPEGLKAKHLEGFVFSLPSSGNVSLKPSNFERKRSKYEVWSVPGQESGKAESSEQRALGEEMKTLSCLLPRKKKKGKLYIAPKPIAHNIIITHAPATPHKDEDAAPTPSIRESVPTELLKHRFLPYGVISSTNVPATESMDVDVPDATAKCQKGETPRKKTQSPEKSSKKRKGETETPTQKSKKPKL